jgi:integrase
VIVVILRLGLRAGEAAALRLEDLDWRAGQVTVHGKGHRAGQLPLPVDAGEAIAGCLCRGRPGTATVREVSVRVRPPRAGLSRGAVRSIVARAAGRARRGAVRAHRLRHTAASDMLRAGAPLGEIGQVLRQRSPGSTAACARVDAGRLRAIARPRPAGAAS